MASLRTGNPRGKTYKRPTGRPPTKHEAALAWLRNYLSGGRRSASEIEAVGAREGYGWTLLKECKTKLGISSTRVGHEWYWKRREVSEPAPPAEPPLAALADFEQSVEEPSRVSSAAPGPPPTIEPDTLPFPAWSDQAFDQADLLKVTEYSDRLVRINEDEQSPYDQQEVAREIARCNLWAEKKVKALPPRPNAAEPETPSKPENPSGASKPFG